jgi:GntR family transcriptional regulator, arabinose operon transcriptional repressor
LALCDQFVERSVSGVFFAPLEMAAQARETNLTIVARLEKARIPIVLLDRCVMPYPSRSRHDLVGVDNRRAAYMATEHLLRLGAPRVSFLAHAGGAPTVEARVAGFREALLANGLKLKSGPVCRVDAITEESIRPLLNHGSRGDGFVCANDRTAGQLMRVLLAAGYRIPQDIAHCRHRRCGVCQFAAGASDDGTPAMQRDRRSGDGGDAGADRAAGRWRCGTF